MTDDLNTKLAVLTEDRPEPIDPAAPIRLRIQRRRRRRGGLIVVGAATVTAAAVAVGPLLGSLHSAGGEPGVAGFAPPVVTVPSVAPSPGSPVPSPVVIGPSTAEGDSKTVMPPPWSAEVFTKLPDANAYRPKAYYIAKGSIPTEEYGVLAFSRQGCIVTDEGPATSFGRIYVCFDDWKPGQHSAFYVAPARAKEKSEKLLDFTLVVGATSADARKVRIKSGGKTYVADAVGTPATDKLRFFSYLIPAKDAKVASVTPVNAAGKLAAAPR
ncbi:hypothetical protein AB0L70_32065 [Kribbella sp. NPDC051952]|uniref:hypothetical protein n=1 Tax=Kribbella sp. NPDC051952 TaxID=3154851 RepID=UPI003443FE80